MSGARSAIAAGGAAQPNAAVRLLRSGLRLFASSPSAALGGIGLLLIVLIAALGPLLYPVNPFAIVHAPMAPPGVGRWQTG